MSSPSAASRTGGSSGPGDSATGMTATGLTRRTPPPAWPPSPFSTTTQPEALRPRKRARHGHVYRNRAGHLLHQGAAGDRRAGRARPRDVAGRSRLDLSRLPWNLGKDLFSVGLTDSKAAVTDGDVHRLQSAPTSSSSTSPSSTRTATRWMSTTGETHGAHSDGRHGRRRTQSPSLDEDADTTMAPLQQQPGRCRFGAETEDAVSGDPVFGVANGLGDAAPGTDDAPPGLARSGSHVDTQRVATTMMS